METLLALALSAVLMSVSLSGLATAYQRSHDGSQGPVGMADMRLALHQLRRDLTGVHTVELATPAGSGGSGGTYAELIGRDTDGATVFRYSLSGGALVRWRTGETAAQLLTGLAGSDGVTEAGSWFAWVIPLPAAGPTPAAVRVRLEHAGTGQALVTAVRIVPPAESL